MWNWLPWSSVAGDIAFRFLEYVSFQQERQKRRKARSMQTPSWQDISSSYSTEEEEGTRESMAVVCDINKEMLNMGKQKADSMGIKAGKFLLILKISAFSLSSDLMSVYTGFPVICAQFCHYILWELAKI